MQYFFGDFARALVRARTSGARQYFLLFSEYVYKSLDLGDNSQNDLLLRFIRINRMLEFSIFKDRSKLVSSRDIESLPGSEEFSADFELSVLFVEIVVR